LPVHGATDGGWSSTRGRVLASARVGVLARWVTPGLVDEVVAAAGRGQRRFRALPARLVVYFVLGLCLYSHLPYPAVVKELASGMARALRAAGWRVPSSTALTSARRRVGDKPFELLLGRVCPALPAAAAGPWSHICGLLAVAWDGTTVTAPASPPNIAAFGRQRGHHYPQLRLVTLVACGTRALIGAAIGPMRGPGSGERALAGGLPGHLRRGMLLIADRGFCSYRLWQAAAGTGADLLWRVTANMHLPVARALPDRSWLSVLPDPVAAQRRAVRNGHRRRRGSTLPQETGPLPGITVRVIEFYVHVDTDDGRTRTERYRLITTLLDPAAAPAADLAAGYAWRWAIETGLREFKTYLRGPGRTLRGRTPALARQELWAYLVIYQAIRAVICAAAARSNLDPDRISFTTTLHAIRRTLPAARTSPRAALAETQADILSTPVPARPGRLCIRAVAEPRSAFPRKHSGNIKTPLSQHASYTLTINPAAQTPYTASQAQQPQHQQAQPP